MASKEWILSKVEAYRTAWRNLFGTFPSIVNVALAVAVAWHETRAGDAWPGLDGILGTADDENNWGATTLRALNRWEQSLLATEAQRLVIAAGLTPRGRMAFNNFRYYWQVLDHARVDVIALQAAVGVTQDGKYGPKTKAAFESAYPAYAPEALFPAWTRAELNAKELEAVRLITPTVAKGHAARASEAMRVLLSGHEGTGLVMPEAVIHCDSTPKDGPYFVWFKSNETPVKGAEYFIKLLAGVETPKPAKAVLERGGTPHELAAAMYSRGYFRGFVKPVDNTPEAKAAAAAANIKAYGNSVAKLYPRVLSAQTT